MTQYGADTVRRLVYGLGGPRQLAAALNVQSGLSDWRQAHETTISQWSARNNIPLYWRHRIIRVVWAQDYELSEIEQNALEIELTWPSDGANGIHVPAPAVAARWIAELEAERDILFETVTTVRDKLHAHNRGGEIYVGLRNTLRDECDLVLAKLRKARE